MFRSFLFVALAVGGCATSRTETPETAPSAPASETPGTAGSGTTGTSGTEPTGTEAPAGETTRIALGSTATVGAHRVQFVAVDEDSRCPEGVTCVWEGRARVRLDIDGTSVVLTVPHGAARPDEPDTAGGVRLAALHPYPGSATAEAGATLEVEVAPAP